MGFIGCPFGEGVVLLTRDEILAGMSNLEGFQSLSAEQKGVLTFVVRGGLDFGSFLERLPNAEAVTPEVDRVAEQILLGVSQFNQARSIAEDYLSRETAYEKVEYEIESMQGKCHVGSRFSRTRGCRRE